VVIVEAVIDQSGRVSEVALLKSLTPGVDEAALDSISQWTFEPATLEDGTPVPVYYTLASNFDLQ
jgi:TonB family protein